MKRLLKTVILMFATVIMFSVSVLADTAYKTVTVNKNGDYIETQTAYRPVGTIEKIGDELLNLPSDMVIFDNKIFIADTGNKRIVISSLSGEFINIIGNDVLAEPKGIFVSEDGMIFVTDPTLKAVFCFSTEGKIVKKYEKPTEPLYGAKEDFVPMKVAVDGKDNLYIVCKSNSNGVVQLSRSTGDFLGYFGANDVTTTLWERFFDSIFTEEQKSQLKQTMPASISNVTVDNKGIVYTMTDIKTEQVIRKLNMSGNDMLTTKISFENPSDLAIGNIGNIYAVTTNGYILEFNSEGDLLFIFGGFDDGSQRIGLFGTISAIALDENGRLYIMDDTAGHIQTFESTEFTYNVHKALSLYQEGRYLESKEPWEKVLLMNNLFDYAHKGIAEAYYMEENYEEAMKDFRLSNDKAGYSKTFTEYRNIIITKNIFIILGAICILFGGLFVSVKFQKRKKALVSLQGSDTKSGKNKLLNELLFMFKVPKNPFDAYYGIKREGKVSCFAATIWYVVFGLIYLSDKYLRGYIFSNIDDGKYSLIKDIAVIVGIFALGILSHYLISSICEGEASLKNVYCGVIYSLMPYIVLRPAVILLTHFITVDEVFIINMINFVIYAGSVALLISMVIQLNNFKIGETAKCIFWTVFSFFLAVAVLFILYIMTKQAVGFISEIINEVKYNVKA